MSEQQTADQGVFPGMTSVGLTKREYIAAMALQGILANSQYEPPRRKRLEMMALDAVTAADALMRELQK